MFVLPRSTNNHKDPSNSLHVYAQSNHHQTPGRQLDVCFGRCFFFHNVCSFGALIYRTTTLYFVNWLMIYFAWRSGLLGWAFGLGLCMLYLYTPGNKRMVMGRKRRGRATSEGF